jgi:hypothetical protein
LLDWAFSMGSWYLERWWGFGNITGDDIPEDCTTAIVMLHEMDYTLMKTAPA